MKKTFELNGIEYAITPCTAIAECDEGNESARQAALLVIAKSESGETVEHIVFVWELPETAEDFSDMCDDFSAWEALSDDHHIDCNGMSYDQYRDSIYGWITQTA